MQKCLTFQPVSLFSLIILGLTSHHKMNEESDLNTCFPSPQFGAGRNRQKVTIIWDEMRIYHLEKIL
jgi:hypothetical protein